MTNVLLVISWQANQSIHLYISSFYTCVWAHARTHTHTHTHTHTQNPITFNQKRKRKAPHISYCVLWPPVFIGIPLSTITHTNDEYLTKCSPLGPTREHTQPGYCFCGQMFSLRGSEEVLPTERKIPTAATIRTSCSLPRLPSGGGWAPSHKQ